MRLRRYGILTTAVIASAAALSGCGGGGDDEPARTATVEANQGLRVVGDEYSFDPEAVVVASDAGALEITLENQGDLAHNLRVFEGDTELGGTPTFDGGETQSGEVELEPGSYRMVCTVADHEELGMVGELEVR